MNPSSSRPNALIHETSPYLLQHAHNPVDWQPWHAGALAPRPGGWPLTMFLAPDDHTPFFGGTYFPKEPRYGMPAFTDLCRRVAAYYHEHRDDVTPQTPAG